MQGYKVYISGESYAGMYCPYIANAMLNTNDTTYHQLSAMYLGDAVIGDNTQLYQSIPMLRFVEYHSPLFPFNNTFLDKIRTTDAECGYSSLLDNHLVYPPISHLPSTLPEVSENGTVTEECTSLWWWILEAALRLNPCFDMYHITASCPRVSDVLGFLAGIHYIPEGEKRYLDRGDVKAAIHAPRNVTWEDGSGPSIIHALPSVIDKTQNVIIVHGQLDMVLPSNGSLLAIQNMTTGPSEPFYVPDTNVVGENKVAIGGEGVLGSMVSERELTWVGVNLAGHMLVEAQPGASYRQLEYLLGRVDCMNCTTSFTVGHLYYSDQAPNEMGEGTAPQSWSDHKPEERL
ncbi:hypothetical protein QC761_0043100 [Podospora bellae-mahoneyi]|uniref:Carboxypeptidase n=1 Tax=Podospora bellae-mahoneyi TaxID=2093777 RepID=A0ABR0FSN4_9PEZI|nr:hypothetical protein QC761_0043100 [Podospora bellae-mahoneyi]